MGNLFRHIHIMKAKSKIAESTIENDSLPPFLQNLKGKNEGLNVPLGYFNSLSPLIVDRINKQKSRSFFTILMPVFRNPLVLVPTMATVILAIVLVFSIQTKNNQTVIVNDEITELNMAYDASYAEEALLAEAHIIDNELESANIGYLESVVLTKENEPSDEEITEYLIGQEIDPEILN